MNSCASLLLTLFCKFTCLRSSLCNINLRKKGDRTMKVKSHVKAGQGTSLDPDG